MSIKYCCDTLRGHLESRGNRGISLAVTGAPEYAGSDCVFESGPVFVLESRAISEADLQTAAGLRRLPDLPEQHGLHQVLSVVQSAPLAKHYARFQSELPLVPDLLKEFGIGA